MTAKEMFEELNEQFPNLKIELNNDNTIALNEYNDDYDEYKDLSISVDTKTKKVIDFTHKSRNWKKVALFLEKKGYEWEKINF